MNLHTINMYSRKWEYMSGVDRDTLRIKQTGEIFSPSAAVKKIIKKIESITKSHNVSNLTKELESTVLDPAAGDGQFLTEVLLRKLATNLIQSNNGPLTPALMKKEIDEKIFIAALKSIYGVELESSNVIECRKRLACGSSNPKVLAIINSQIFEADFIAFAPILKLANDDQGFGWRSATTFYTTYSNAPEKQKAELVTRYKNEQKSTYASLFE